MIIIILVKCFGWGVVLGLVSYVVILVLWGFWREMILKKIWLWVFLMMLMVVLILFRERGLKGWGRLVMMEFIVKVVLRLRKEEVFELLCWYWDFNFLVRWGIVLDIVFFFCFLFVYFYYYGVLFVFFVCLVLVVVVLWWLIRIVNVWFVN